MRWFSITLAALLMLGSCADTEVEVSEEDPKQRATEGGNDADDPTEEAAYDRGGFEGTGYHLTVSISDVRIGENGSQVDIEVAVASPPEEEEDAFPEDVDVELNWTCGDDASGSEIFPFDNEAYEISGTLSGLPVLQEGDERVECSVRAFIDHGIGEERIMGSGISRVFIESSSFLSLKIEVVNVGLGTPNTVVTVDITILRDHKPVVAPDVAFKEEVEVVLSYECYDSVVEEDRSTGEGEAIVPAQSNVVEGVEVRLPPKPAEGEAGYSCLISAKSDIEGYGTAIAGKKKVYLEGRDLLISLTTALGGFSLQYTITAEDAPLSENVDLALSACSNTSLVRAAGIKQPVDVGSTLQDVAIGSDEVFISGTGTGCVLTATSGLEGEDSTRSGESSAFDISPLAPPFSLNSSGQIVPNADVVLRGTIQVFKKSTGNNWVALLDASAGVSVATALRDFDGSDLSLLPTGNYLVFIDEEGEPLMMYEYSI